jgi:Tol biopolymer transport system component
VDERFSWNTYSVPVLGGTPQIMLPNAAGLTWIGNHQLLFSEIKTGINMGIVTSDDSRMHERQLYLPPTARGMAHRSALSPDGNSVLLAEMDNSGWQPCRVLPFDGGNAGRQVGPLDAQCTYVAWSPDGKWMYFSAARGGGFHLWRQRVSGGEPEQITFGPTEQEGIAVDPDGKFLITAAGTKQSELWLHSAHGERQISSEGFAAAYQFSPDGKQLFYMVLDYTAPAQGFIRGTLRSADLQTGTVTHLLPGVAISDYDLTHDGKQVVYAAYDEKHRPHLWMAPIDRSSPPRQLFPEEADEPRVTDSGVIYYRARINGANWLFRYKPDGTREQVGKVLVNEIGAVSPDGKWVSAWTQNPTDPNHSGYFAINAQDFSFVQPCPSCGFTWSANGRRFIVITDPLGKLTTTSVRVGTKTIVVLLRPGEDMPKIPPGGWQSAADFKGYKVQEFDGIVEPSPDGESFVAPRRSSHRNLFRIPLQ